MTNQVLYVLFACFLAGAAAIAVLYIRLLFGKRDAFAVCSVALGEVGVKSRIKKTMSYKKPTLWVIVACLLLCAILAVLFLTDPKKEDTPSETTSDVMSEATSDVTGEESVLETTSGDSFAEESSEQELSSEESSEQELSSDESSEQELSSEESSETSFDESLPDESSEQELSSEESSETSFDESLPDESSEQELSSEESSEESSDESSEPERHPAMQPTHQTPEDIPVYPYGGAITPIQITLRNAIIPIETYWKHEGDIQEAGLKVWICDGDGNKIDYVYTNSQGVALFEAPEGYYTFFFEGSETYTACYGKYGFTCAKTYGRDPLIENAPQSKRKRIYTYPVEYHAFRIYVTDAETGKPLEGVKFKNETDVFLGTTDQNGYAACEELLSDYDGGGTWYRFTFEYDGYDKQRVSIEIREQEIHVQMSKTVEYEFSITVLDMATGKPVEGIEAKLNRSWSDKSVLYQAVSDENGRIYGMVTSEDLAYATGLYLCYDMISGSDSFAYEKHVYLSETQSEYTVYIETEC